mmetsp:Transcript_96270/g.272332  ORF Transcript_96270/g.272332 Transcript_96270/m.272332 type:complete len:235 (+) Transcript_96270:552-1256(+)
MPHRGHSFWASRARGRPQARSSSDEQLAPRADASRKTTGTSPCGLLLPVFPARPSSLKQLSPLSPLATADRQSARPCSPPPSSPGCARILCSSWVPWAHGHCWLSDGQRPLAHSLHKDVFLRSGLLRISPLPCAKGHAAPRSQPLLEEKNRHSVVFLKSTRAGSSLAAGGLRCALASQAAAARPGLPAAAWPAKRVSFMPGQRQGPSAPRRRPRGVAGGTRRRRPPTGWALIGT